jgi:hypothetical protein
MGHHGISLWLLLWLLPQFVHLTARHRLWALPSPSRDGRLGTPNSTRERGAQGRPGQLVSQLAAAAALIECYPAMPPQPRHPATSNLANQPI